MDAEKEFAWLQDVFLHPVKFEEFLKGHPSVTLGSNEFHLSTKRHERGSHVPLVSGHAKGVLIWNHATISPGSTVGFVAPLDGPPPVFGLVVPEATGVEAEVATNGRTSPDEARGDFGRCCGKKRVHHLGNRHVMKACHAAHSVVFQSVSTFDVSKGNDVPFGVDVPFVIRQKVGPAGHPVEGPAR
jgi:hypothetical protein